MLHDLLIKSFTLLSKVWLQEARPHLLDNRIHIYTIIVILRLEADELEPLASKAWTHLYSLPQVEPVVLRSAEHTDKELAHTELVAVS